MTRADGRSLSSFLDSLLPLGARSAVLTAAPTQLPPGAESWQPPHAAVNEDEAAEQELSALAARGVEYLVVPRTSLDWLAAHPVLEAALGRSHRLVTRQQYICEVYELIAYPEVPATSEPAKPAAAAAAPQPARRQSLLERIGLRAGQLDGR
jgi:hypothetical protein